MKYYLLFFSPTRNVGAPVSIRHTDDEGNFFGFIKEKDMNTLCFKNHYIQKLCHHLGHLLVEWSGVFLSSTEFPVNNDIDFFIDREAMRASSEGEEITIVIPSHIELLEKETKSLFLSTVGDYRIHLLFLRTPILCRARKYDEKTSHWLDHVLGFLLMHGIGNCINTEHYVETPPPSEAEEQADKNTIDIDLLPF